MSIFERLLTEQGFTLADIRPRTSLGQMVRADGVAEGPEFRRIKALPERSWADNPDLPKLVAALTRAYRTPAGAQILRPAQAAALADLHDHRGLLAAMRIGAGKTAVSFLAPVVLESRRPLLFLPANLVDKTRKEFLTLSEHWKGCTNIEILSVEKFSRAESATYLDRLEPDLILSDEAYVFKNLKSGRSKRLKRYLKAHPECLFVPLSGTFAKNSIHDYAHLSEWALRELSPVPRTDHWQELSDWADAADVKPRNRRIAPGVLSQFHGPNPVYEVEALRAGLKRRREATPGWISVDSSGVDCSLVVEGHKLELPAHMDEKFMALRREYQTPDGYTFAEPTKLWQYLRQCSAGFWYRYDPKPPDEWKEARKQWASFVRETLSHNRQGWDTEFQVANACSTGKLEDWGLYETWKEIRPSYDPDKCRHTEWIDDTSLNWCQEWLDTHKGIVFTPFPAFGQKLKELTGLPFFHAQGEDSSLGSIETFKGGPCIASIKANMQGRNLQDRWSRALVVGGLGSGPDAEQLLGRLHRPGQEADCVTFDVLYACRETYDMWWKAREEAKFAGDENHKLLCSDWLMPSFEEASSWTGPRWEK